MNYIRKSRRLTTDTAGVILIALLTRVTVRVFFPYFLFLLLKVSRGRGAEALHLFGCFDVALKLKYYCAGVGPRKYKIHQMYLLNRVFDL